LIAPNLNLFPHSPFSDFKAYLKPHCQLILSIKIDYLDLAIEVVKDVKILGTSSRSHTAVIDGDILKPMN